MVTRMNNMSSMTCDLFIHTSNYMKFLIDEISQIPNEHIPHGIWQISQELTKSLLDFAAQNSHENVISTPGNASSSGINSFQNGPGGLLTDVDNSSLNGRRNDSSSRGETSPTISGLITKFDHLIEFDPLHQPVDQKPSSSLILAEMDDEYVLTKQRIYSSTSSLTSSVKSSNASKRNRKRKDQFYITEVFRRLLETIITSPLGQKCYFYCRCCNAALYSAVEWNEHVLHNEKHIETINANKFVNKELFCIKCNLVILGSEHLIRKYLQYHDNILHSSIDIVKSVSEGGNVNKEIGQGSRDLNVVKSGSKNAPSGKQNVPHIDSKPTTSKKNSLVQKKAIFVDKSTPLLPKPALELQPPFVSNDDIQIEKISYVKEVVDTSANTQRNSVNNGSKFFDMIKELKSKWSDGVLCAGNCCFCCNEYFLSGFQWIDHLESGTHKNASKNKKCTERTCRVCNLRLFGEERDISKHLLSNEHIECDSDFKKKKV